MNQYTLWHYISYQFLLLHQKQDTRILVKCHQQLVTLTDPLRGRLLSHKRAVPPGLIELTIIFSLNSSCDKISVKASNPDFEIEYAPHVSLGNLPLRMKH